MPEELRIAIVTDVHHGPDRHGKRGGVALDLLARFVAEVNRSGVDLAVDLGDRISNVDMATDRSNLADVAAVFRDLAAERHHLVGNHDVVNVSVDLQEAALATSLGHRSVDRGGWHLVFWNASCELRPGEGFLLAERDLEWLESDLARTGLPSVVFSHMPFDEGSMVGNHYFERRYAGGERHKNARLARDIVERSEKVVLAVSGHVHWTTLNRMDGIPYITLQSLSEAFTTHPHPAEAWAVLTLGEKIGFEVLGRDPMRFTLPVKRMGHHWLPPLR